MNVVPRILLVLFLFSLARSHTLGDPAAEIAADPPLGVNQPGLLRAAAVRASGKLRSLRVTEELKRPGSRRRAQSKNPKNPRAKNSKELGCSDSSPVECKNKFDECTMGIAECCPGLKCRRVYNKYGDADAFFGSFCVVCENGDEAPSCKQVCKNKFDGCTMGIAECCDGLTCEQDGDEAPSCKQACENKFEEKQACKNKFEECTMGMEPCCNGLTCEQVYNKNGNSEAFYGRLCVDYSLIE